MNVLRKPLYSSLIIFLIWAIVIMRVQDLPFVVHHRPLDQFEGKSIDFLELISMIFFFGAVTYLKWWHQVGLKGLENKLIEGLLGFKLSYLRFLWLPIMFLFIHILLVLFTGLPPAQVLMFVLINTLMIGICEELLFRGILFYGASSSFGIWRAIWITTIIFGAVHVLSGFVSGDFNASIIQVFYAFMFGFYMVALRIRLDTIIPGIIIHWLWDYLIDLTYFNGYSGIWGESSFFYIAFFAYGLWLLRDYIPKRYNDRSQKKYF
jgi:membrane protease YdiL (CAAX protease family)